MHPFPYSRITSHNAQVLYLGQFAEGFDSSFQPVSTNIPAYDGFTQANVLQHVFTNATKSMHPLRVTESEKENIFFFGGGSVPACTDTEIAITHNILSWGISPKCSTVPVNKFTLRSLYKMGCARDGMCARCKPTG